MNTKKEIASVSNDLKSFKGASPEKKLDDKAAMLESHLADARNQLATERSLSIFVISAICCIGVGLSSGGSAVFWFSVAVCLVLNIFVAQTIGSPLLATYLEPWNIRLQKAFDIHVLKKSAEDEFE